MPPPIPIAFGITDLDVGGAEKMLVALATGLNRNRWSPSVVSLQPPGRLLEPLENAGIPVDTLDLRSAAGAPPALWKWQRILAKRKPRLLQTFLIHANVLGRVAGRWAEVPKIISGVRVADRRQGMIHRIDRWTASLADLHICVSEGVRDFSMESLELPPEKFRVIPNGVKLSNVTGEAIDIHSRLRLPANAPVDILLFVGRLDPQKGLLDLLTALQAIHTRRPLTNRLHVVLVGEGPERSAIELRLKEDGLGGNIHLMGWQPDPLEWLRGADGLILPSHWEGMPNAVLEALSVGCPVIATDVEGTREIVRPGKTGWLVPVGQPGDLAKAIEEFLDAPKLRRKYGTAGKALVTEQYTIERMIAAYERCYDELI